MSDIGESRRGSEFGEEKGATSRPGRRRKKHGEPAAMMRRTRSSAVRQRCKAATLKGKLFSTRWRRLSTFHLSIFSSFHLLAAKFAPQAFGQNNPSQRGEQTHGGRDI